MSTECSFTSDETSWANTLMTNIKRTPLVNTLDEAVWPIKDRFHHHQDAFPLVDGTGFHKWDDGVFNSSIQSFEFAIREKLPRLARKFGVPAVNNIPIEYLKGIHAYTLENPSLYKISSHSVVSKARRGPTGTDISNDVRAILKFYRFLIEALKSLPDCFRCTEEVYRGVKWCFPAPDEHNPEEYFEVERTLLWFEFKSSSTIFRMMYSDQFCGQTGPRTIFTVQPNGSAWHIDEFSYYGVSEAEVMFMPLSLMKVVGGHWD